MTCPLSTFLDMAPEDPVINPSSLTKFRKLRLKDRGLLDLLIYKTADIELEKNLIKSKRIIVDATHTKSRYNQKSPKEFLMDKSKNVRKAVCQIDESMKEKFPPKTTSDEVKDEMEYCQKKKRWNRLRRRNSKWQIESNKKNESNGHDD